MTVRSQPWRNEIERSSVELVILYVGNAHGTSYGTELWPNFAKLASEAISFIDSAFCIFEDHAALVLEIRADCEIENEVWHQKISSARFPIAQKLTRVWLNSSITSSLRLSTVAVC
jgi:hypothetical protein